MNKKQKMLFSRCAAQNAATNLAPIKLKQFFLT